MNSFNYLLENKCLPSVSCWSMESVDNASLSEKVDYIIISIVLYKDASFSDNFKLSPVPPF